MSSFSKMAASALFRTARTVFPRQKLSLSSDPRFGQIHLWSFLNPIFNKVDAARVKECGPDRAAAEWIVRCGGSVRWQGLERYHKDYNSLPGGPMTLEGIDATESCIMDVGFSHFKGLKHLKELNLTSCDLVDDRCLGILAMYQKETLQKLRIVSCTTVSDTGLGHLAEMKALQSLILAKLAGVDNPEKSVDMLRKALPECQVEYLTGKQLSGESSAN